MSKILRFKKVLIDANGRLSLDLLIGLSIFLFTFVFIAQFLPGVFADVRSEIALSHEAYKVTVMLAETEGVWSNGTHNGTNWEDFPDKWGDPNFVFLPGLTTGRPDFLEYRKILAFANATRDHYDRVREMLGLKLPDREYNFHVSLESLDSKPYNRTLVRNKNDRVVLDVGAPIPTAGYVSRYERNVWIDAIYNLTGVYYLQTKKGSAPTPVTECYLENGGTTNCIFTYTYPVNVFILNVGEFTGPTPTLSICGYISSCAPGACAIGSPNYIHVNIEGQTKDIVLQENKLYDLTRVINNMFRNAGATYETTVCLKMSYRKVNASLYQSNTIDYIAGRAAAKLVVWVW